MITTSYWAGADNRWHCRVECPNMSESFGPFETKEEAIQVMQETENRFILSGWGSPRVFA
jgi:hypothetical protein